MPLPQVHFIIPPSIVHFDTGNPGSVTLKINPLSEQPFHIIFTLAHDPAYFQQAGGAHSKTFEFLAVQPTQPYSGDNYAFDLTIYKDTAGPVGTKLFVSVISEVGKATEDKIGVLIH